MTLVVDDALELQSPVGHKVLVVDDETGILRGCERVLKSCGHTVLLADRAEDGLEILREHSDIDLALVDLRMPGMDGLELLAATRDVAPETVFVVITAYATIEAAVEATKRGAYDFLAKPFSPDELLRMANRAFERVELIRERNRLELDRRRRMLELTTEQSRLRTIINCMAEGVLVCNAEQRLVLYNPAALRALVQEAAGETPADVSEVVASPELVEMIADASSAAKRVSRELELPTEGEDIWALVDVAPVTDETSGQFLGTVSVLRDITELKRVELLKAQFVNMVAHELRAPLAAIDGYLSVMLEDIVKDPEKQKEMMVRSKKRLGALVDLVGELLDMARMDAGTVRREIASQRVGEVIDEVVQLMRALAEESMVTIETNISADLPGVEADREELIRLFTNLVSNAVKYNREGGSVTVTAAQDGPYVSIAVADTGVGISEDGLKRLFNEFFREKTSDTRHVTGTGLGLSIVKRIVDFYHGRIDVQSTLGEGSTFTVRLPSERAGDSPSTSREGPPE